MNININKIAGVVVFVMVVVYGVLWLQTEPPVHVISFDELKENMAQVRAIYDDPQEAEVAINITCRVYVNIAEVFDESQIDAFTYERDELSDFEKVQAAISGAAAYEAYGKNIGDGVPYARDIEEAFAKSKATHLNLKSVCLESNEGGRIEDLKSQGEELRSRVTMAFPVKFK